MGLTPFHRHGLPPSPGSSEPARRARGWSGLTATSKALALAAALSAELVTPGEHDICSFNPVPELMFGDLEAGTRTAPNRTSGRANEGGQHPKGSQDPQSPRNPGETIRKDLSGPAARWPRERPRRSPDIFPPPAIIAGAEPPPGLFPNTSVGHQRSNRRCVE